MELWSNDLELEFFNEMLNTKFLAKEKVFYKIDNNFFAYIPKGIKANNQTLQSRNSFIGHYTEMWSKRFFEPIANKFGLYAVQNMKCEELGLSKLSGADLAFCTTDEEYQKPANIKLIFEIKMSIVSNYKLENDNIKLVSDYTEHQGTPSLLRSDSMLKAIGKCLNVRVASQEHSAIPIIVIGNSPIAKSYEKKVDTLKKLGVIQGFISLFPDPTTKSFITQSSGKGFITINNYSEIEELLGTLLSSELYYFSSMLPLEKLGKIIKTASKELNEREIAIKFLMLLQG